MQQCIVAAVRSTVKERGPRSLSEGATDGTCRNSLPVLAYPTFTTGPRSVLHLFYRPHTSPSAALTRSIVTESLIKMGKKKNKSAQNQAQANNPERNGTSTPASVSASDTADQPDISAVDMALDPGEEGAEEQQDEQAVGPAVIEAEGQARDAVQAEAEIGTGVTAEVGEEAEAEEGAEAGPSARRATAEIAALEDVQKAAEQQVAPTTESAAAAASTASHARNGSTSHAHDGRDRAEDRDKAEPAPAAGAGAEGGDDRIRELEDELARVRDEKDALDGQYRSLLGKLTTMRKSLGEKLREDAVSFHHLSMCCLLERSSTDGSETSSRNGTSCGQTWLKEPVAEINRKSSTGAKQPSQPSQPR